MALNGTGHIMYDRYAIYYTPDGPLAAAGAAWLGWDVARGQEVPHPRIDGVDVAALTDTPRKYGLHGTVKPPFVLKDGMTAEGLLRDARGFCADSAPVTLEGLALTSLGGFLALTPVGDQTPLGALAAQAVSHLDPYRAAPTAAELERRRQGRLTPAQEENLARWGYPYVMDQFRFHITLTGRLPRAAAEETRARILPHFAPHLPAPFVVDHLTLAGQRADGRFEEIERMPLGRAADGTDAPDRPR